ncbi:thiolase family protein [Candidatus Poriferisocius sp.]|uniref:thiolase family protein n=1 Tax=Candidatus Poriferisocius sp. TaxID=3101276 RepID=UPI003B01F7CA
MSQRDVYVIGVGMVPFGRFPEIPAALHGARAGAQALDDAGVDWQDISTMYCGASMTGGFVASRVGHLLGLNESEQVTVDNASASGSSAFRQAVLAVGEGRTDVALAVGCGKMDRAMFFGAGPDPLEQRIAVADAQLSAAIRFALIAQRRMHDEGLDEEVFHRITVKSHRHASLNPNAQYRKEVTLEQVLESRLIADPIHLLECTPTGDGGAAAVVATREVAERLGRHPRVRVMASQFRSAPETDHPFYEYELTKRTASDAYEDAGIGPSDLDLCQVHDAFSSEELEYYEALGVCDPGEGGRLVMDGDVELGGRIPFNTDGGLVSRGHPLGPTGLAQIWETTLQLRGQAGPRQIDGARFGLAQMIGAGGVCVIHILGRD